jgi:hypothetical protein
MLGKNVLNHPVMNASDTYKITKKSTKELKEVVQTEKNEIK